MGVEMAGTPELVLKGTDNFFSSHKIYRLLFNVERFEFYMNEKDRM